MAELEMWGPDGTGNPDPPPDPTLIRLIDDSALPTPTPKPSTPSPQTGDHRQSVKSFRLGSTTVAPELMLWNDEPVDHAPPLPALPHIPIEIDRHQMPAPEEMEMQFQRRH